MEAFIYGFILAFSLILPMGPQNVFIFTQGINQPTYRKALPSILTASISDTLLILVAVFSLTMIADIFENLRPILLIGGFVFLLYMGWTIWKASAKERDQDPPATAKKQVAFAASVSLLNPHALLDTIGVIGTQSLIFSGVDKWLYMTATISVSWLYFFMLALLGRLIGHKDKNFIFRTVINKLSAITMWVLAIYMLFHL
ncbi:LysE/ArgO family amino acid transporter [Bacillus shivajii]|uniref:LysE/ArgO family amino acid transporter n=1 Tax=Bacillus shivajii TaxID=1983719 RepID=UPI001CF9AE18|nr:LysE/ArgO family amino acid transporter [Bacillus shivajii]UCZ53434.1 LysE/ArgO family amino acid transporter [Bacillus shivajii]